jgi:hypothetical protein
LPPARSGNPGVHRLPRPSARTKSAICLGGCPLARQDCSLVVTTAVSVQGCHRRARRA